MTDPPKTGQSGVVGEPALVRNGAPAGDFSEVFRRHHGFVWRLLRHFGVPEASLDDAAQDVFVVVHRRFSVFDGRTTFRSWLWGIARRVAGGYHRSAAREGRKLRLVAQPSPDPGPEPRFEQRETVAIVQRFLDGLPEGQRDVFVLAELEGMTAPEIGEALEIKLNTVYSRLRTARLRFKRFVARLEASERGEHG